MGGGLVLGRKFGGVFRKFSFSSLVGGVTHSVSAMRVVEQIVKAPKLTEGAGFTVHRPVGSMTPKERTDPFLMLDELGPKDYRKGEFEGAPWHPHRGFDTVMYLKQGEGSHQDSSGNKGTLKAGDVQWMTAASGLQHDEGRDHPGGTLHGFQMWVNLPAANKMDPPSYHDIAAKSIAFFEQDGVRAKIIAGEVNGTKAIIQPKAEVQYIDFMIEPGTDFKHAIPKSMTTLMCYVYKGSGVFGQTQKKVNSREMAIFKKEVGDGTLIFRADDSADGLHFLLMAGKPLNEPIAQHGPFVMNTQREIQECFRDYQSDNFIRHKGTYAKWGVDADGKPVVEKWIDHDNPEKACPLEK